MTNEPTELPPTGKRSITLKINRKTYKLDVEPRETLLDVLRERLDLIGSKKGCNHGQCGACTVQVDGRTANACLLLAVMQQGHVPVNADIREIDTVFIAEEDELVNPAGVKGIGEIGIVGTVSAIANAIYHATGKRHRELPITPDKVLA